MGGDPEQDYFADGLVEEITTALTRVNWIFVIARNSSFTYKGRAVDLRTVGRELGVRYVLQGSVRRLGAKVRIGGQLIHAATGRQIWAERFDGDLTDVFELQDRVTDSVVAALEPSLRAAEIERASAKPTQSLDAYDLYLRALPKLYASTREGSDEALAFLSRAIDLDPEYSQAKALAALAHVLRRVQNWSRPDEAAIGLRYAREALARHNNDPSVLRMAGHALANLGREFDAALIALDAAIALAPSSAQVHGSSGWVRFYVGDGRTSANQFERAIRLSPLDPEMAYFTSGLCMALLAQGDPERAVEFGRRAVNQMPLWTTGIRGLIMALVEAGRIEEARSVAVQLLSIDPTYTVGLAATYAPQRDPEFRARYLEALRRAGVPE